MALEIGTNPMTMDAIAARLAEQLRRDLRTCTFRSRTPSWHAAPRAPQGRGPAPQGRPRDRLRDAQLRRRRRQGRSTSRASTTCTPGRPTRIWSCTSRCRAPSAEVDTVTDVWPAADWHERESWDMLGIRYVGHPDLRRILLKDDFVGPPAPQGLRRPRREPSACLDQFASSAPSPTRPSSSRCDAWRRRRRRRGLQRRRPRVQRGRRQHGAAAPLDARRAAAGRHARRRARQGRHPRDRLPAPLQREDRREAHLLPVHPHRRPHRVRRRHELRVGLRDDGREARRHPADAARGVHPRHHRRAQPHRQPPGRRRHLHRRPVAARHGHGLLHVPRPRDHPRPARGGHAARA